MRKGVIWLAALCCLLSGCAPHARELDSLALVRVLGVDGGERVTLTAVCGGTDQADGARGSAAADSFEAARRELPWVGEQEMALTNLSYIIVGAQADLVEALTYVLEDREMSPTATVWLAADAGALLGLSGDPASRLAVLEAGGIDPPTAVEALAEIEIRGGVSLPVLVWDGSGLEAAGEMRWEETG